MKRRADDLSDAPSPAAAGSEAAEDTDHSSASTSAPAPPSWRPVGLYDVSERDLRDMCHFLSARGLARLECAWPWLAGVCRRAAVEKLRKQFSITVTEERGSVWHLLEAERLALTTRAKEEQLRAAAREGKLNKAREVLNAGVNPEAADPGGWPNRGKTACILAAENGHLDMVTLLINKARVDVNKPDQDGFTALILAAGKGHTPVVVALIEAGATLDLQNQYGETALIRAVANGHTPVVVALIEAGANLDLQDMDGWTALIQAAYSGHDAMVRALVEGGADTSLKDQDGKTALDIAKEENKAGCVAILSGNDRTQDPAFSTMDQIMAMGFTTEQAQGALQATGNNVELALNLLLENPDGFDA